MHPWWGRGVLEGTACANVRQGLGKVGLGRGGSGGRWSRLDPDPASPARGLCSPVGRVDRHLLRPLSPSSHILPSLAPQLGPPSPVDTLVLPSPDPLVAPGLMLSSPEAALPASHKAFLWVPCSLPT